MQQLWEEGLRKCVRKPSWRCQGQRARCLSRFPCSIRFRSWWDSCAPATCEGPHIWANGYSLNRAVEPGESMQKQVPGRNCGSWGAHACAVCSWMTASWGKYTFWSSSGRTETHGKDPCGSAHEMANEVSPKGRAPHWSRGRALLKRKEKHIQWLWTDCNLYWPGLLVGRR